METVKAVLKYYRFFFAMLAILMGLRMSLDKIDFLKRDQETAGRITEVPHPVISKGECRAKYFIEINRTGIILDLGCVKDAKVGQAVHILYVLDSGGNIHAQPKSDATPWGPLYLGLIIAVFFVSFHFKAIGDRKLREENAAK